MPARVVHFLVHVPRSAGTTLDAHLAAHLGDGFLIAPRWRHPLRLFLAERRALRPDDPRLAGLRAVSGHSLGVSLKRHFPGAEFRELVLLREPVARLVSLYNLRVARARAGAGPAPPDFAAWLRSQRPNPMSHFLLSHYFELRGPALYRLSARQRLAFLEARLARFWFVGDVARADALIATLGRALGLPERAPRRNASAAPALTAAALDPALVARLRAEHPLDQALWQRWKDRGFGGEGAGPGAPPPALPDDDRLAALAADIRLALGR